MTPYNYRNYCPNPSFSQGCAFWGFRQKMVTPPPPAPKFLKFGITKAVFCSKHEQILAEAPPTFVFE